MDSTNEPEPRSPFSPLLPEDRFLFLDAGPLASEHRSARGRRARGHHGSDRRRCHECDVRMTYALVCLAARARERGWTRDQALEHLPESPAAYGTMVISGDERARVDAGALARPRRAAFGAFYTRALSDAHSEGRLSISVSDAQELLGFIIAAVQDQTSPVEAGEEIPWRSLGIRMGWELHREPEATANLHRLRVIWAEIVRACQAQRGAARLLDQHVFAHSANAARQVAPATPNATSDDRDPLDAGEDLWADDADHGDVAHWEAVVDDPRLGYLVEDVAGRLVRRRTLEAADARAEVRRYLHDHLGHEVELPRRLVEALASEAIQAARTDLVELDAVTTAVNTPGPLDEANVQHALALAMNHHQLVLPYNLDRPDGAEAYQRWLRTTTSRILATARRARAANRD